MTRRVDFSGNAAIYDRRHGVTADEAALKEICESARLEPGSTVLDVGAGTGRVAIPLCDLGYRVVAAEPARGMLDKLSIKADGRPIEKLCAEGSNLPIASETFDAVAIARLMYLAPDWRHVLDEAARVLKSNGVFLHEWGNGTPDEAWVQVREKTRALLEEEGIAAPFHPGARHESQVESHLTSLGFVCESRVVTGSGQPVTIREFLRRLTEGELSYLWEIPIEVREKSLPRLQKWVESSLDLDTPIPIPRHVEWTVYRRHPSVAPRARL